MGRAARRRKAAALSREGPVASARPTAVAPGRYASPAALPGLERLSDLHEERRRLEAEVAVLVQALSAAGVSWGAIGRALGLTRQGARQRYGA